MRTIKNDDFQSSKIKLLKGKGVLKTALQIILDTRLQIRLDTGLQIRQIQGYKLD